MPHLLMGQNLCNMPTNKGRDFWFTYIPITHTNANYGPADLRIIVASDSSANVTVTGPGGTYNIYLAGGGQSLIRVIGDNDQIATYNTPFDGGFHITSDRGIWVYAVNSMQNPSKSCETATILPTNTLDTVYIAQDYPAWTAGNSVAFVAVEDSTVLTMTVPCSVRNTTLTPGSTLTITLQQGEAYNLYSSSSTLGFAGMRVSSNGKPFAMFHGAVSTRVPINVGDGGDLTFEQALPLRDWGTDFIVPGLSFMSGNSHIRITVAEDNTHISIDGDPVPTAFNAGWSHELTMPVSNISHITSDKPVSVILYMACHTVAGNQGDPAAVTIPPIDRGVCKTMFKVENIGTINNNYITVVLPNALNGRVLRDGVYQMTGTDRIDDYIIHRIPLAEGHHSLVCNDGPFVAFLYGFGPWEGYAYPLGFQLDTTEVPIPVSDTIIISDSVCQGYPYNDQGFNITASETAVGDTTLTFWRQEILRDTTHNYCLLLTVLPTVYGTASSTIILGDTLVYGGTAITTAGTYSFTFTAAEGCDSVVTLNVSYEAVGITADKDGICPGEAVTITATGTHFFRWSATPPDAALDSLQGRNPITVHPMVTTVYRLLDAAGNTVASLTVGTAEAPALCVEVNRYELDFDNPVVIFNDCSEGRHHTVWTFDDGQTFTGSKLRRQFRHPLPDSVVVRMTSCNQFDCCADTTLSLPMHIRSVWFPNIFTPNAESNNLFGCYTSFDVEEFRMVIYNRWGIELWSTEDINTQWDGRRYDGTPCPQGAYVYRYWITSPDGTFKSGIGTVTLLH